VPAPLTRAGAHLQRRSADLALVALAVLAGALAAPRPAAALASTQASLRASLSPNRLGANAALTIAVRFSGGSEGIPAPLRAYTLHLPAGLSVSLRGGATCSRSALRRRGASGCAAAALLGRGHARMEVHAGSQTIPEQATLWAFRGRARSGSPTLEILGEGSTPLNERTVSTGVLRGDSGPFGSRLAVTIPPIPTVELEPDASFDSFSLTLGGAGTPPRARGAAAPIRVPGRCPSGGFPFAAELTFADGSSGRAGASVPCP
jgi:hypothetical protein